MLLLLCLAGSVCFPVLPTILLDVVHQVKLRWLKKKERALMQVKHTLLSMHAAYSCIFHPTDGIRGMKLFYHGALLLFGS